MTNMRIGMRLMWGFGIVVGLSIVLGIYALGKQSAVQTLTESMNARDFASVDGMRKLNFGENQMQAEREAVLVSAFERKERLTADAPEVHERKWLNLRDQNLKSLTDLENSVAGWASTSPTGQRAAAWRRIRAALHDAQEALAAVSPEVERQFSLIQEGNITEAVGRTAAVQQVIGAYQARLAEAQRATEEQINLGKTEVAQAADETRDSIAAVLAVTVAVGLISAVFIQRSITKPLAEFVNLVERVGQGDLTQQPEVMRKDELGDLGRSLSRMVQGLKDVAIQTRVAAEEVNTATAEILASTQQQAASTAEQAAAVQQANATMAELSQSGAQISNRAKQVAAAAEATSSASAAGMQSVQNNRTLAESIREQAEAVAQNVIMLSEKTQAVGDIIATVNDIAEQSHLLALNAAIQAAAAGEHGRSFSVVAAEMKNLAGQSKQATVQVRSILGDIQKGINSSVMLTEEAVKRVQSGRQQADAASLAIRELTGNIEESIRAFQQIVGGSNQQQIGFEQVIQAFRSIGIATQETASSTRQSEKAAANLSALAKQLRSAVERYRV